MELMQSVVFSSDLIDGRNFINTPAETPANITDFGRYL